MNVIHRVRITHRSFSHILSQASDRVGRGREFDWQVPCLPAHRLGRVFGRLFPPLVASRQTWQRDRGVHTALVRIRKKCGFRRGSSWQIPCESFQI